MTAAPPDLGVLGLNSLSGCPQSRIRDRRHPDSGVGAQHGRLAERTGLLDQPAGLPAGDGGALRRGRARHPARCFRHRRRGRHPEASRRAGLRDRSGQTLLRIQRSRRCVTGGRGISSPEVTARWCTEKEAPTRVFVAGANGVEARILLDSDGDALAQRKWVISIRFGWRRREVAAFDVTDGADHHVFVRLLLDK